MVCVKKSTVIKEEEVLDSLHFTPRLNKLNLSTITTTTQQTPQPYVGI